MNTSDRGEGEMGERKKGMIAYGARGLKSGTTSSYVGTGLGTGFARPFDDGVESGAIAVLRDVFVIRRVS